MLQRRVVLITTSVFVCLAVLLSAFAMIDAAKAGDEAAGVFAKSAGRVQSTGGVRLSEKAKQKVNSTRGKHGSWVLERNAEGTYDAVRYIGPNESDKGGRMNGPGIDMPGGGDR